MRIDGKAIADAILTDLASPRVKANLAVTLIGDNPASLAYIKQKQKAAEKIGATIVMSNTISDLKHFNNDPSIHGIIVQRPVPKGIGEYHITPKKDVDGFEHNSPFDVPVAMAVWEIIKSIHNTQYPIHNVVVVGRGETVGAPIANYLLKKECATSVIHSQTPNPKEIMKQADIIISCVGKERVVTQDAVKPGAILISVGLWRDETGKLRGDYNEEEIADVVSFYTPTPGGVGPVNVACLMQNLIKACMMKRGGNI